MTTTGSWLHLVRPIQTPATRGSNVDVDLWLFGNDTGKAASNSGSIFGVLSATEQQRAVRYRVESRRLDFLASRFGIRHILGGYLNVAPSDVPLNATATGQPFVGNDWKTRLFDISISHTAGQTALAVTSVGVQVGLDIECPANVTSAGSIEAFAFTRAERNSLVSLSPVERCHQLLKLWTAKEAALKALGCGCARPLTDVEVRFGDKRTPDSTRLTVSESGHSLPHHYFTVKDGRLSETRTVVSEQYILGCVVAFPQLGKFEGAVGGFSSRFRSSAQNPDQVIAPIPASCVNSMSAHRLRVILPPAPDPVAPKAAPFV